MAEPRQYVDTPATVHDVVTEITDLMRVVTKRESAELVHREHWEQRVAIAQAKTALALESWLGPVIQEVAALVVSGLEEPLLERLAQTHDRLHEG